MDKLKEKFNKTFSTIFFVEVIKTELRKKSTSYSLCQTPATSQKVVLPHPTMAELDASTVIVTCLKQHEIRFIFGIVGIPVTKTACEAQNQGIQFVGMRNEQVYFQSRFEILFYMRLSISLGSQFRCRCNRLPHSTSGSLSDCCRTRFRRETSWKRIVSLFDLFLTLRNGKCDPGPSQCEGKLLANDSSLCIQWGWTTRYLLTFFPLN